MEQDQLRKRLTDAEIKSARTIHNVRSLSVVIAGFGLTLSQLNKEISELEALVESKVSVVISDSNDDHLHQSSFLQDIP
jgi:hypothetical protein